jgi:hypothetical protein
MINVNRGRRGSRARQCGAPVMLVNLVILGIAVLGGPVGAEQPEPSEPSERSERSERQKRPEPEVHGTFHGDPMYTVLPLDAIPAITEPQFLGGEEAAAQMSADEPVLGLVVGGEARAYSLWQLDSHEIVNDEVGGVALAATW